MTILTILKWIVENRKSLFKAILSLAVGFLLYWGITLSNQNKKLSERLETAQNNIEAYQGVIKDSQQANNVLRLNIEDLQNQNDDILHKLDSVRQKLKIKPQQIDAAATQTQVISVKGDKGVQGDLIEILKDTTYSDSIQYNNLTKVHYTIGVDTVSILLDIKNTQYLYIYSKKEYKNKKSWIIRLLTLDFKKVKKYKYDIINSNSLLDTSDVRVVEADK